MTEKRKDCGYKTNPKSITFLARIGMYRREEYEALCAAYKETDVYKKLMDKKTSKNRPLQERED